MMSSISERASRRSEIVIGSRSGIPNKLESVESRVLRNGSPPTDLAMDVHHHLNALADVLAATSRCVLAGFCQCGRTARCPRGSPRSRRFESRQPVGEVDARRGCATIALYSLVIEQIRCTRALRIHGGLARDAWVAVALPDRLQAVDETVRRVNPNERGCVRAHLLHQSPLRRGADRPRALQPVARGRQRDSELQRELRDGRRALPPPSTSSRSSSHSRTIARGARNSAAK